MIDTLTRAPAAPVEPTTPIRPSEALRLGRLLRPVQDRYHLFSGKNAACALGAMLAGAGYNGGGYQDIAWAWPDLAMNRVDCPADGCATPDLSVDGAVVELFDCHEYTDDQIVAWLESLGL